MSAGQETEWVYSFYMWQLRVLSKSDVSKGGKKIVQIKTPSKNFRGMFFSWLKWKSDIFPFLFISVSMEKQTSAK